MGGLSNIEFVEGEARRVKFRLRRLSNGSFLNVNGANGIRVEVREVNGLQVAPIACDRYSGYDDWVNGLVTALFSPLNTNAAAGTYQYSLSVDLPDEDPVFVGGRCEVKRNGTTQVYSIPGYGTYFAQETIRGIASTGGVITPGTPVVYMGGEIVLAPAGTPKPGIAINLAEDGQAVVAVTKGWVELNNWLIATGFAALPPDMTFAVTADGFFGPSLTSPFARTTDSAVRLRLPA